MKVIGNFNNISDQLKPEPLKRGEVVYYRLLNGSVDPTKLDENGQPLIGFPKSLRIPTKDTIWDPFKNNGKGEFVDIGVVQEFSNNQVTRTRAYYVTNGGDFRGNGLITLSGDSNADIELYEYLEICNLNKSFEYRDPSVAPVFERVDYKKENTKKLTIINEKMDALVKASSMSVAEMRDFVAQMNWNEMAGVEEIKVMVLSYAEKDPKKFLELANDENAGTRSLIKQALTKGVINFDAATNRILWGKTDQTIATLDRIDGKNHVEIFADWLLTAKNGSSVKTKIEQQVHGTRKAAKEGVAE